MQVKTGLVKILKDFRANIKDKEMAASGKSIIPQAEHWLTLVKDPLY